MYGTPSVANCAAIPSTHGELSSSTSTRKSMRSGNVAAVVDAALELTRPAISNDATATKRRTSREDDNERGR